MQYNLQPDEEEAEAVFIAILEHEGIRQLNISQNQINKVNPDTLAKAVNSMEQVGGQILTRTYVVTGVLRQTFTTRSSLLGRWTPCSGR